MFTLNAFPIINLIIGIYPWFIRDCDGYIPSFDGIAYFSLEFIPDL